LDHLFLSTWHVCATYAEKGQVPNFGRKNRRVGGGGAHSGASRAYLDGKQRERETRAHCLERFEAGSSHGLGGSAFASRRIAGLGRPGVGVSRVKRSEGWRVRLLHGIGLLVADSKKNVCSPSSQRTTSILSLRPPTHPPSLTHSLPSPSPSISLPPPSLCNTKTVTLTEERIISCLSRACVRRTIQRLFIKDEHS
jgi:hypothetical protein